MDYLKSFRENVKCFFKGDGQKLARECQEYRILQNRRKIGAVFIPWKRVSDYENQISRIISECEQFLALCRRVTSCDGRLYCI